MHIKPSPSGPAVTFTACVQAGMTQPNLNLGLSPQACHALLPEHCEFDSYAGLHVCAYQIQWSQEHVSTGQSCQRQPKMLIM